MFISRKTAAAFAVLWFATAFAQGHAQTGAAPAPAAPAESPVAQPPSVNSSAAFEIPSSEGLIMPKLAFVPTPEIEAAFEKYFYFHRENTSFAEAYADIRECDALASGSSIYVGGDAANAAALAQYGVAAGAIGGAIGSALADAIVGSAERRKQRRVNLRTCLGYKQYQRYGLDHDQWSEFNFEEGLGRKKEVVRNEAIALQALVASGPKPSTKELGR